METDTGGKRAFRTVNHSKFVFEAWQKTKLVMERGRLRKKRRHPERGRAKKKQEI